MNSRLLLLGSAMGLVLSTGALAQSPSSSSTTAPSAQTQTTTTPSPSNTTNQSAPATATSPIQAQPSAPPASGPSSQVQTTNPNASGQAQQAPASSNTTAQQPAQTSPQPNTAQTSTTNANVAVNINDQQRTQVTQSIARLNVQPLTNVNFSLSIGAVVPRDVHLEPLPADVVTIVPQYRGYNFFVVRDEIVIVEPSTYKIVTVLPRSASATATAPAPSRSKVNFSDKDREVVRKHARSRTEMRTTGSTTRVEIRRGERLPDSVAIEEFPETVYREVPTLRDYRYIHRENRTYLVNPSDRMVIEEID